MPAAGADYIGVGAMFPTGTKADASFVPMDALKLIALRRKPINHIEMEDENGKNI